MKAPVIALLVVGLALSGCATVRESRFNPRNWFGGSTEEQPTLGPTQSVIDNRALVPQVSALSIERTSSGAIVRAEAVMPEAGWWDPELVPENHGRPVGGVMTFRFVAAAPREAVPGANPALRTVTAVYAMSEAQLEVSSEIVVTGAQNSRRARR